MRKSRSRVSRRNYGIGKLAGSDVTDGADHVRNSSPFPGGNSRNQARIADIGSGKLFIARKSLDNSKSGIRQRIVGSNPTLSASFHAIDALAFVRNSRIVKRKQENVPAFANLRQATSFSMDTPLRPNARSNGATVSNRGFILQAVSDRCCARQAETGPTAAVRRDR